MPGLISCKAEGRPLCYAILKLFRGAGVIYTSLPFMSNISSFIVRNNDFVKNTTSLTPAALPHCYRLLTATMLIFFARTARARIIAADFRCCAYYRNIFPLAL